MKIRMVKRLAALALCLMVGLSAAFPLMGAAYAAADTGPTVGVSENSAPADSATCICETKCSSASKNAFCPVCLAGDDGYLNCAGKALEPEPAPACFCDRSEERRVGEECRSRWTPYH